MQMQFDRAAIAAGAVLCAAPPRRKKPAIHQCKVVPGDGQQFWFLNNEVTGVMVHYDREEKRTYPCNGKACWADHTKGFPFWQGWIAVFTWTEQKVRLFRVTPHLTDLVPELVTKGSKLRGRFFHAKRHGNQKNSPLEGWFKENPVTRNLPLAPDVLWNLQRMWSAETPLEEEVPPCRHELV
jgi:hypothetical protein